MKQWQKHKKKKSIKMKIWFQAAEAVAQTEE